MRDWVESPGVTATEEVYAATPKSVTEPGDGSTPGPASDAFVTTPAAAGGYFGFMVRVFRLGMFLPLVVVIAAMIASLFHVAWYDGGRAARCVVLRGLMLEAWNGGAYYRPGFSLNAGGTRYVRLWPPDGKFIEDWRGTVGTTWRVQIPLWMPLVVTALPAAFALRSEVRRRRAIRHGACPTCGYSRIGLEPDTACPECGTRSSLAVEASRAGNFTSTTAADSPSSRRAGGDPP